MSVFYLSFADPERPKGTQWLGGCYVRAQDEASALTASHLLGINPGGEAGIMGPIPLDAVDPAYLDRLLTSREDIEAAGRDEP